jgi:hypothetical protein
VVGVRGAWLLISTATGDTVRAVPGVTAADRALRWSPDGRSIWVSRAGAIEALDLASGARTRLVSGVSLAHAVIGQSRPAVLADDPRTRAYLLSRAASELFVVERPR